MSTQRSFTVFGDPVAILATAAETNGAFSVITQTCKPGGGPPPHRHENDDEWFYPLSGSWELFNGATWTPLTKQGLYAPRGHVHTFRNAGDTEGTILIFCSPGGLDNYLETISVIQMPQDVQKLIEISDGYGIIFPMLQPPAPAQTEELAAA